MLRHLRNHVAESFTLLYQLLSFMSSQSYQAHNKQVQQSQDQSITEKAGQGVPPRSR